MRQRNNGEIPLQTSAGKNKHRRPQQRTASNPIMMSPVTLNLSHLLPPTSLSSLARDWLAEDAVNFDPAGVCVGDREQTLALLCKTPGGVLAGVPFFDAVFNELGCAVDWFYPEGTQLGPELVTRTALVRGPARNLLLGERPALNCLARASGIATRCRLLLATVKKAGWAGGVAGTRKTTPGFRLVEKYSMLVGGVATHRHDLSGMVMLKDNHVWASGSITQAVSDTRRVCGFSSKIEVECRSEEEGREAARAGAEIIMLDNFTAQGVHAAAASLKREFPSVLIEVSGGLTEDNLPLYSSPRPSTSSPSAASPRAAPSLTSLSRSSVATATEPPPPAPPTATTPPAAAAAIPPLLWTRPPAGGTLLSDTPPTQSRGHAPLTNKKKRFTEAKRLHHLAF
ncbi:nicotinate-nucleotide pyrophosphorylase [Huso huso]|uniref:Nicotinate-nucleotide pyrophosphorylase [carboxylating] n=1 Tax=Huso huso TaxID=61971 RepID=A0ABR0Y517_HUSHU